MVDTAGSLAEPRRSRAADPAAGGALVACVDTASPEALERYRNLCINACFSPAQSPAWIEAWSRATHADMVIAELADAAGAPQFALALETARCGPLKIARFAGGSHANGNFPATTAAFAASSGPSDLATLHAQIHSARPDIDLLILERQELAKGAVRNPLTPATTVTSPNSALAVDLDGGFEAVLSRVNARRKLKKHRSQQRKFEAAGGYRRLQAETAAEVNTLLDAFFAMKSERFGQMGIADVFEDEHVRDFFRRLFTDALDTPACMPAFVLHGLEVGGRLRAVTGSSVSPGRLTCDFAAIALDELTYASPGDFLFFENIREACKDGFAIYDFGVGDEPYKREWCGIETAHFDALVPLNTTGRIGAAMLGAMARAKHAIKQNRLAWSLVRRVRKLRARG